MMIAEQAVRCAEAIYRQACIDLIHQYRSGKDPTAETYIESCIMDDPYGILDDPMAIIEACRKKARMKRTGYKGRNYALSVNVPFG